jgi:hypothetical protein
MEARIALLLLVALVAVDADGCENPSAFLSETFPADGRVLRREAEENRAKLCETEMADIVYEIERTLSTAVAKGSTEVVVVFLPNNYPHVTTSDMESLHAELRKRNLYVDSNVETCPDGWICFDAVYFPYVFRISLIPPEETESVVDL